MKGLIIIVVPRQRIIPCYILGAAPFMLGITEKFGDASFVLKVHLKREIRPNLRFVK